MAIHFKKIPPPLKQSVFIAGLCLISICSASGADSSTKDNPQPSPNTVFLCKDGGETIYTNTKLNKSCKSFLLGTTITSKAPAAPGANVASQPTSATPPGFPKVNEETQKARDTDRKRILEEELAGEQKNLDLARKELAQQESKAISEEKNYKKITERLQPFRDKVAQHERNIQALRKEMSNLK